MEAKLEPSFKNVLRSSYYKLRKRLEELRLRSLEQF